MLTFKKIKPKSHTFDLFILKYKIILNVDRTSKSNKSKNPK
jgi:hypothetical protein